ncbi:MAG: signal peptidase I [Proteobacteria bacterium]|nr:signal peptidase I [Pseudomonadota bacterium]
MDYQEEEFAYHDDEEQPKQGLSWLTGLISPGAALFHFGHLAWGIAANLSYVSIVMGFFLAVVLVQFFPIPGLFFLFLVLNITWFGLFYVGARGVFGYVRMANPWMQVCLGMVTFWLPLAMVMVFSLGTVMQRTWMSNDSMRPGILHGDTILVDRLHYRWFAPERGDLVLVEEQVKGKNGQRFRRAFFARVIAVPGDSIQIQGGQPYVNGQRLVQFIPEEPSDRPIAFEIPAGIKLPEDVSLAEPRRWYPIISPQQLLFAQTETVTLEAGQFFVLEDNRDMTSSHPMKSSYGSIISGHKIKGQPRFVISNSNDEDSFSRFGLRLR